MNINQVKDILVEIPNLTASETDSSSEERSESSLLCQDDNDEIDIYEDVRERMEELSKQDKHSKDDHNNNATLEQIPFFVVLTTYLGYAVLIVCGHVRDTFGKLFRYSRYMGEKQPERYAVLLKSWENFYTRRLYHRIQDCFNRPISTNAGGMIGVMERVSVDGNKSMRVLRDLNNFPESLRSQYQSSRHVTSETCVSRFCLNLGSYNYLGFADDWGATCATDVLSSLECLPAATCSSRCEAGSTVVHKELEDMVASFVGKECAMVFNMGFNTNCSAIPALTGPGDLIVSDELNHTSIVNGARASGAAIRIFKHNDETHLEQVLKEAIVFGRPRVRRPFRKILVIVEGVYSMEGHYCNLAPIVQVCKKYKAYLYLDEAHSIGAMGPNGKGVCDFAKVNPKDVDILMGTFTKSFGGMGGYIASSKAVIEHIKSTSSAILYHTSLSPVVCQQIITAFKIILGQDNTKIGKRKLRSLRDNSNYFRMRLIDMGLHVLGNYDSPIIPIMLYNPTKIAAFSRECFKRGIAVVVVGFPAVPILMSRARFCISAAHNREELDKALEGIEEVANMLKLKYATSHLG